MDVLQNTSASTFEAGGTIIHHFGETFIVPLIKAIIVFAQNVRIVWDTIWF